MTQAVFLELLAIFLVVALGGFARQRYWTVEGEATASIVFSTFAFVLTAPLWRWVLQRVT